MDSLPTHIGFIVDGNRRWASARGLSTYDGHKAGFDTLKDVLIEVLHSGVRYASAYVFSTENWKRSEAEVKYLMRLLVNGLKREEKTFIRENVRVKVIGSRERLSNTVKKAIDRVETVTRDLTGGELLLLVNYGGHLELVDAVKSIVQSGVSPEDIDEETIVQSLYAPEVPPCDMIVRTSGEQRLSNFMTWRSAYSELMFIDKLWPDMTKQDVGAILDEYKNRKRRFGG